MLNKMKLCFFLLILIIAAAAYAEQPSHTRQPMSADQQKAITFDQILSTLRKGNQRFVANKLLSYDYRVIRQHGALGQHPFAIVLSCIDSRSAPDIVFDQPLGNLFVARVAGNVVDTDILGSMEFATQYAGAKMIIVMGHTHCGAVAGACKEAGSGQLEKLLNQIEPAVKQVAQHHRKDCQSVDSLSKIAQQNVIDQIHLIYQKSAALKKGVDEKKILLVGAMHHLETGQVDFFYKFQPQKKTGYKSSS